MTTTPAICNGPTIPSADRPGHHVYRQVVGFTNGDYNLAQLFTAESPVSRLLRDAKLMEIGAGTSEVGRMLIGREVVKAQSRWRS